jgi:hypothetical protein
MLNKFLKWIQGPAAHNATMSELDRFIQAFEAQRTEEPASRVQEKKKNDWIALRRDQPIKTAPKSLL